MKWFRFYSEVVNDPKVQRLSGDLFKLWVNLLCLANENSERGALPADIEELAWKLRMSSDDLRQQLHTLQGQRLLDWCEDTEQFKAHNWSERQKASDDVTARVNKLREGRNVTETLHETESNVSVTPLARAPDKIKIKNREEEIREEKKGARDAPTPTAKPPKKVETSIPDDFTVTQAMYDKMHTELPELDIEAATERWVTAMRANTRKYRYTDWRLAWYNGMRNATQWATERGGSNGNETSKSERAILRAGQEIAALRRQEAESERNGPPVDDYQGSTLFRLPGAS
jgi:hypothetical protein